MGHVGGEHTVLTIKRESLRATVTLKKKVKLFRYSPYPLEQCLVQLWTEVGESIRNQEVMAQSNAPPEFVSRLVCFSTTNTDGNVSYHISSIPRECPLVIPSHEIC